MSNLPKLDIPHYKHHLVGLNKTVQYRPFTVKEQKILLLAKESGSRSEEIQAIKQIIGLCVKDNIKVDNLAVFDVEDLFLRIRARSVSNVCEIRYKVKDDGGNDTKKRVDVEINLDDVNVVTSEDHTQKIMLTPTVGLMMKYPTIDMIEDEDLSEEKVLIKCIDYVFDAEEVYHFNEFSDDEVADWIDSFDMEAMKKIKGFFDTLPKLRHEVEVDLPDGGTERIVLEGIADFFT